MLLCNALKKNKSIYDFVYIEIYKKQTIQLYYY